MKIYFKNVKILPLSHDCVEIVLTNFPQNCPSRI